MEDYLKVFSFIYGSLIGSFLNVLIYRLPLEKDIVFPRSSCPHCHTLIPWFRNIPIFTFLFQLGKCANCKGKIPISYFIIELLSGIVAFLLAPKYLTLNELTHTLIYFSIYSVFIVHFVIDLKHKILPDSLNLYLAVLFLIMSVFSKDWHHWLYGGLIGFAFPYGVAWGFYLLKGEIGLGGGDIKLFGALGLLLGPLGILYNIFLSCFLGAIVSLTLILTKQIDRKTAIPFGPFIIAISSFQIFFPEIFLKMMKWLLPSL